MLPLLRNQSATLQSFALLFVMSLLVACGGSVESDASDSDLLPPGGGVDPDYPDYTLVVLDAGDDLETRAQEALITADPKTIVQFPAGIYNFVSELSVSVDNIVLRGAGMTTDTGTVLRFDNQVGAQGIFATGNNFVVQDLAVENTPGDSIKVQGSDGVTIQRVRIEWTNGPDENNGAYGLYPVQTRNVLIEDCEVRGASDAGVYVGQSEIIIVRRNYVYENVAGIEIENSKFADVYENNTTGNTGGILVFDLPGPPVQGGEATRVFDNLIVDNNEPNFAPEGNIVGTVPTGTGLMIMANDDIEAFGNTITGNQSLGVLVVSYYIPDWQIAKPSYDPVPEKIYIHDNTMSNNAYDPQDTAAVIATMVFGGNAPDFVYDSSGVGTNSGELLKEFPDGLSESQAICFLDNGPESSVGYFNFTTSLDFIAGDDAIGTDPEFFNCRHASLPPIVLEPPVDPEGGGQPPVDTEALCGAEGTGLNTEAFVADCPNLSDYRLFADPANPLANANDGIIYDLNTPLFTDYAKKYRFVFVPGESPAVYRSDEEFDFPVGTVIAKTFTIQADLRDDASPQEIIETRLLIRRKEGWKALPYIWNQAKNDADLTLIGGSQDVSWIDSNGVPQSTQYAIPDTNECVACHEQADKVLPLGPKARHLNKNYNYDTGAANQLDYWAQQGILLNVPVDKNSIVTIPLWGDTAASLDDRARGYLDVNCMHCHSPDGAAGYSGLLLEYSRPFGFDVGECKPPVAAGGGGVFDYVIVPGNAAESIMDFRMDSNETEVRMPELGRSIIHTEGVQLVRDWINSMSGGCS